MNTATLILNPAAGNARIFHTVLPEIKSTLNAAGYNLDLRHTDATPGSAAQCAQGCSGLVIACGGDGTVHGIAQALANTAATLGVLPLGTANALARNLGLPMDPLAALKRLLTYVPTRIPLGEIETAGGRRFFLVMAGCGPDGALVHSLSPAEKSRFGRRAYYAHAARLFLTRRWPSFDVEYLSGGKPHQSRAVAMMSARVPNLGGAFSGLTPHAGLTNPKLHIQLLSPPAQLSFPAWFALSRARLPNPWLKTIAADELRCLPITHPVFAQADAEPMGPLPFTLRIIPAALTLLMPR